MLLKAVCCVVALGVYFCYKFRKNNEDLFGCIFITLMIAGIGFGPVCLAITVDKTDSVQEEVLDKYKFKNGNMVFYTKTEVFEKNGIYWSVNFDKINKASFVYDINSYGTVLKSPKVTPVLDEE